MYHFPDKGTIYITGRIGSFLSFFLSTIADRKIVLLYEEEDEALLLKEEIEFFSGREVHYFPRYSQRIFEKEDESKRIAFLHHLLTDGDFIGLFPAAALFHQLFPPDQLTRGSRELAFGDTILQEELTGFLESAGYELTSLVREQGDFAKRGAIIDIFPPSSTKPLRIELLGDQVYSIRYFDPASQRSLKEVERCLLIPTRFSEDGNVTLLDYIPEGAVIVHRGAAALLAQASDTESVPSLVELETRFSSFLNVDTSGIRGDEEAPVFEAVSNDDLRLAFEARKTEVFKTLAEKFKSDWAGYPYLYVFAVHNHQAERLHEIFKNYDIALPILPSFNLGRKEKEWGIVIGPLRRGFRTENIIVLTEEEIVGPKKRVVKKKWEGVDEFLNSFKDLAVGEYVVHMEHGIGIYRGIRKLKVGEYEKDFLLIEYQDDDRLYVPIDSLELVQKYIGGEKAQPKIDRLGSMRWKSTKSKVKTYVEDIAKELIQFYAERELAKGHAYPPEDEIFREMEERFEFEETEGQLRAIEEVLRDLQKQRPMDRIVCGDVGFGKTEVALRAAFKAVMDAKQIAVLVPTTVLAQQHYRTFVDRLKDYPVIIEMLSRFRSKEEQALVVERLNKGAVDVIVGTHRLLQKDIAFKDLGLLIIDEEHRFGVKAKEKLKFIKKDVDVLTLSATPIPRTLHMAVTGIKDLSIIDTPPLDRLAVKTSVVKFNDELIKKAVANELGRGGQVFFVHNVVHNIGVVHGHLKKLLPDAKIAVAHGQMRGSELEKIMLAFINNKYDILLSTNIIESGLDITNVNTVFINNAHRFGLADLYQLRGRVGRGKRQAYAYLLVPKEEVLTRDALVRLKVIEEMTELGSGLKVANYDLEIRGTGNLLGREQSGHINLIGFELYCKMIDDAVRELRQEGPEVEEFTPEINIPINAFIPDAYIPDETSKLLTYKRLSRIKDEVELSEMREELRDRYGTIPEPLENLLEIISLRLFLMRIRVKRLDYSGKQVAVHVTESTPLRMEKLLKLVKEDKGMAKILPDGKIVLQADGGPREMIGSVRNMLMNIMAL
ncbi:MAG TPA: transcription-repair coupling factor [Syntrophorhabdales bacterium]|nr:transcription-repair coupling factor [Syntrophorhabdales bacterium]